MTQVPRTPTHRSPCRGRTRPLDRHRPPRVLVLERQSALRRALRDLLRRQGLEVTAGTPESVDLQSGDCPWDAVVFNATQRSVRRQRWLFGYRPDPQQTRLVALHEGGPPPAYERYEVDAMLPYPFTVSRLMNAILGQERQPVRPSPSRVTPATPRSAAEPEPTPATSPDDLPPRRAA